MCASRSSAQDSFIPRCNSSSCRERAADAKATFSGSLVETRFGFAALSSSSGTIDDELKKSDAGGDRGSSFVANSNGVAEALAEARSVLQTCGDLFVALGGVFL